MNFLLYRFRFGFESPADSFHNRIAGCDAESSGEVEISARSKVAAEGAGQEYAESLVNLLFMKSGESPPEWKAGNYSNWIEETFAADFPRCSGVARINAAQLRSSDAISCCESLPNQIEKTGVDDVSVLSGKTWEIEIDIRARATTYICRCCGQYWLEDCNAYGHHDIPRTTRLPWKRVITA